MTKAWDLGMLRVKFGDITTEMENQMEENREVSWKLLFGVWD